MTTPPRTMSVLGVSTVLALGAVLMMGSCEVPIPRLFEPEAQTDIVDASQENVLSIWVDKDGSVLLNGERYPMEDVSEVVGPLNAESEPALIVKIRGDDDVPYGIVDQLQEELKAAGVVRAPTRRSDPKPGT